MKKLKIIGFRSLLGNDGVIIKVNYFTSKKPLVKILKREGVCFPGNQSIQ